MLLGVIVFSLLFIAFVVFGTLLLCGKGYFFISGYRSLNSVERVEFVSKNNLKRTFDFYAYYCFAVALITLVALVGVLLPNMIIIFVCYLVFGAGTVATLIVANVHSFKVIPVGNEVVKSTPVVTPEYPEAKKVEAEPVVEKVEPAEEKVEPVVEEKVEEVKEEKPVEVKKPAPKKPATKSTTKKPPTKSTTTKSATKKTTTK